MQKSHQGGAASAVQQKKKPRRSISFTLNKAGVKAVFAACVHMNKPSIYQSHGLFDGMLNATSQADFIGSAELIAEECGENVSVTETTSWNLEFSTPVVKFGFVQMNGGWMVIIRDYETPATAITLLEALRPHVAGNHATRCPNKQGTLQDMTYTEAMKILRAA